MQSFYQTNEAQHSPVDSQPVYGEPRPPKKKSKGPLRFIIPIAIVAVAFVIGYFVTGANKLKPPTAFDTPTIHDPIELPSPSINEDATKNGTEEYLSRTFLLSNEYIEIKNTFRYREDGVVTKYDGNQHVYNTTSIDADQWAAFVSGVENAAAYLEESGTDYAWIDMETGSEDFRMSYGFYCLDSESEIAELAAEFMGFEMENGKIMIDSVEEELLRLGYTIE
ncbi:MAG: hypothetical protein ACI4EG_15550 [Fusicatenibacter sp.]